MTIELSQIILPPGHPVLFAGVDWQSFEYALDQMIGRSSVRIAYDNEVLELMTPLLEHEADKGLIGALVEALLEELDIEFLNAGSTTFRSQAMGKGIEPDQCFYIEHEQAVRGKGRIDLTIDPPPDLALEIDITTRRSHTLIYEALGIPELWRFDGAVLHIQVLRNGSYVATMQSDHFPQFSLGDAIPRFLKQSQVEGRNVALRAFRAWVRTQAG